jgi:hypothetical protein
MMKNNSLKMSLVLQSNFITIYRASFTPLVQDKNSIDLTVDIEENSGNRRGKLKVRARWLTY